MASPLRTIAVALMLASSVASAGSKLELSLSDGFQLTDCARSTSNGPARKAPAKCSAKPARTNTKRVYDAFKGVPADSKLPDTARNDASAGVFI